MEKLHTEPFDPARYLTDHAAQRELLADAFASGNAGYIANALGVVARARGMGEVAKQAGVTREGLYKALSSKGDPRLSTFLGVADALDLELSLAPRTSRRRNSPQPKSRLPKRA